VKWAEIAGLGDPGVKTQPSVLRTRLNYDGDTWIGAWFKVEKNFPL
jgi:hypothetical protein